MERNLRNVDSLRQSPNALQPATSARRITGAEKRLAALDLRKAGLSYRAIGRQLGCSGTNAHKYVKSELGMIYDQCTEDAKELRTIELERLDRMIMGLWGPATRGDVQAVDRILKIMDRRSKYLGLDAPVKLAPTTPDGEDEWNPVVAKIDLAQILGISIEVLPE